MIANFDACPPRKGALHILSQTCQKRGNAQGETRGCAGSVHQNSAVFIQPHSRYDEPLRTASLLSFRRLNRRKGMTPELLARLLQEFLAEAHRGVVIEDGQVVFELDSARHAISSERGRCLLHLWSEQRNQVREVLDAQLKQGTLSLSVRSFAKARAHKLEICRDRDRRSPVIKKEARGRYARLLERVLRRQTPDWTLGKAGLSTSMDLEHRFSTDYARGLAHKGRSSLAVLGVNRHETPASVHPALTFGLLLLHPCRHPEPH